ncbi:hypothetical protein LPW11_08680 [Geomonas sp. RF6]|uniref:hypothetical protein n=1 Tax=Geomonas sp. RF6 TaxID=2897342 RepID=UPI001E649C9C|nr:hypothetical protein [Geomonas sp. RF6]UFS72253.1 hypothetical protein LPW11_08680 [Geomonas sp. RF6]
MKVYLFNPETGCYLGEDFADEGGQTCCIPLDATPVAPPKAGPGEVPVFDATRKVWTLQRHSPPACAEADAAVGGLLPGK